ncbi:MAG TPA: LUD domain-containing protein [Negativicutes bacterium]|nr:LUD domain-containing protein [Negativicutes bacterium]
MASNKLKVKIAEGLRADGARIGRDRALGVIKPAMQKAVIKFPHLRDRLHDVKKYSIDHLDELLEKTLAVMRQRGTQVFVAETAQEALEYIGKVVGQGLVVKSKTNAGKEIGVTNFLEAQGAKVVETDLGDRINQLDGGVASHSLAPAIHVPIERVADLFSQEVNENLHPELEELVKAARKSLRSFLERADVGISGANAIVAETGAVVVTENEGNIRAVTSMPRIHLAIAGVEKIVPTLADAITVIKAAAVFGVGQDIGTYISIMSGPSRFENDDFSFLGAAQGPEEMHVVLLKAGRDKAIREGYEETLYCINCGSCLNFCPIYSAIGEKFGYKYLGGRGAVFTAMYEKLSKAQEAGLSLCMGCKRCEQSCAVGIKTPRMISRLRARVVDEQGLPFAKKVVFKKLAANTLPGWIKLAKTFQGMGLNPVGDGMAKLRFPMEGMGMPADRLVPMLAPETFPALVAKRAKSARKPERKAAFFAGCVVNYVRPDLGLDLLDILENEGVEVVTFDKEACCGIPVLQSGDEEDAREMARKNVKLLAAKNFDQLLFVCPTCATTAMHEWPRLLADEPLLAKKAQELAAKAMDISSYLVNVLKIKPPKGKVACKVTYHDPCHLARGLNVTEEPRTLLKSIPGVELVEMKEPNACCGFGGSFSMYYYDLSRRINDDKVKQIAETDADCVVAGCPGCILHLKDGICHAAGSQKVMHTVEILAKAYKQDGGDGK